MPDFEYFRDTAASDRGRLSDPDFAARYGANPDEIAAVVAFAEEHGLAVVETHASRRTVVVSGTVAAMSEAFAVRLDRYEDRVIPAGRVSGAADRDVSGSGRVHLPATGKLASVVIGVFGLDNRNITKRASNGDPPSTSLLPLPEIAELYRVPRNSAAGQTIAVFSEVVTTRPTCRPTTTTCPRRIEAATPCPR